MKYKIPFEARVTVYVDVEAEDQESAIEEAHQQVYLSGYVGNGGHGKLIGVSDKNMTVEAGDYFKCLEYLIEKIDDN